MENNKSISQLDNKIDRLNEKVNAIFFDSYLFTHEMNVYVERKIKRYIERRRKVCKLISKWESFKMKIKKFFGIRISDIDRGLSDALDREYKSLI